MRSFKDLVIEQAETVVFTFGRFNPPTTGHEKLIKKVNRENAPPKGWSAADAVKEDKPEPGKVYALTGGPGARCIANGYSWKDSVVGDDK